MNQNSSNEAKNQSRESGTVAPAKRRVGKAGDMNDENGNGHLKTPLQLEAIEKETRAFVCPHCGQHLQFRVGVTVKTVQKASSPEEIAARDGQVYEPPKPKAPPVVNPALGRLTQYYRDVGILDAFEHVAKELKAHQVPKDMDKFFLNWLKATVRAELIPQIALRRLINEFEDEYIEVWHAQQIGAVVSGGQLRCFMPMHLLRGEVIRAGGGSTTRLRTLATEERLDVWIRTKHGYVSGRGAMFQEMQKQARGSFETTVR